MQLLKVISQARCLYSNRTESFCVLVAKRRVFFTFLLLLCCDIERCPGSSSITAFSKQKGINFVHQNICGLLNKIPWLETFVSDTISKIYIISVSETHINGTTDNDELYKLPGYTFIKNSRKNCLGSGIGDFWKNGLNYKLRDDLQNPHVESIWLKILVLKRN